MSSQTKQTAAIIGLLSCLAVIAIFATIEENEKPEVQSPDPACHYLADQSGEHTWGEWTMIMATASDVAQTIEVQRAANTARITFEHVDMTAALAGEVNDKLVNAAFNRVKTACRSTTP